jgi:hypothetical protein
MNTRISSFFSNTKPEPEPEPLLRCPECTILNQTPTHFTGGGCMTTQLAYAGPTHDKYGRKLPTPKINTMTCYYTCSYNHRFTTKKACE